MARTLDIEDFFKKEADHILGCRENAVRIHPTDIRAAGNEVEDCVRAYFARMLPSTLFVGHGHLIDANGQVSPQIDLIIADKGNLPSLMTARDGTDYVPIDSVYAIGEIKSAYKNGKKPFESFSGVLEDIRENLFHEEELNTFRGELRDDSTLEHILLRRGNRVLNRIFSFMVFVDGGDFNPAKVAAYFEERPNKYLPNVSVLLTQGRILWGKASDSSNDFSYNRYPEDPLSELEEWYYIPGVASAAGSVEGNQLAALHGMLLDHITNSYLERPSLRPYIRNMMLGRRSLTRSLRSFIESK